MNFWKGIPGCSGDVPVCLVLVHAHVAIAIGVAVHGFYKLLNKRTRPTASSFPASVLRCLDHVIKPVPLFLTDYANMLFHSISQTSNLPFIKLRPMGARPMI